jgi:hypothetical protein
MPLIGPSQEGVARAARQAARKEQRTFEREMQSIDREREFFERVERRQREAERRRRKRIEAIYNDYCYRRSSNFLGFRYGNERKDSSELWEWAKEEDRKACLKKEEAHRAENEAREAERLKMEEEKEREREREDRDRQRMNERWRRMGSSLRIY